MTEAAGIGQLDLPRTESIVFGANCVTERLKLLLHQYGLNRPFLISTASLVRAGLTTKIESILGSSLAGSFYGSKPHTPRDLVSDAVQLAKRADVDCLISLGGSSVVDLAKSVALVLAEGDDYDAMHIRFSPETGLVIPTLVAPKLPHIAIPTTLSGSEYTMAAAMTDENRGEKDLYVDPQLVPKTVFQDAALCVETPQALWAGSGMKIVADCIEMICSPSAKDYTDMHAISGLRTLLNDLPNTVSESASTLSRQNCLYAAFLTLSVAPNAGLGLVAGLRHQLGANQKVSHGDASTIMLPHVLRWNLPVVEQKMAATARLLLLSDAVDDQDAARHLIEAVESLMERLEMPTRLRAVGVQPSALTEIADRVVKDAVIAGNPRKVAGSADVLAILQNAY